MTVILVFKFLLSFMEWTNFVFKFPVEIRTIYKNT